MKDQTVNRYAGISASNLLNPYPQRMRTYHYGD